MTENIDKIEKGLADLRQALRDTACSDIDQDQALLLSIRALMDCRPTPCWLKGTNGRMLYINPAYEAEFGIDVVQYVGDKDHTHWAIDTAIAFRDNDCIVASRGIAKTFIEEVEISGESKKYKVLKWPVFINDHLVGVAGESLGEFCEG